MGKEPEQYFVTENSTFPNSRFPVLHYKNILKLPFLFSDLAIKKLFRANNWSNNWKAGIFTYHHYHSITHEVCGIIKGNTQLQLGGYNGMHLAIEKGDVIVIPAGVAHKNLGKETDVVCIGGYPDGRTYDMNYGKTGERPQTDRNIAQVSLPATDPVFGSDGPLVRIWKDHY